MINITRGTTNKPSSSNILANLFASLSDFEGHLYIGYPIIGTPEGPFPIDALLICREIGVLAFNLVDGLDVGDVESIQDDIYNKLEVKLRNNRSLVKKRDLIAKINVVTFAPAKNNISFSKEYPICNSETLTKHLHSLNWQSKKNDYENVLSVIQSVSTIRSGKKKRKINNPDSLGSKLKKLEDAIANLDNTQSKAVIETVEGVQRIRGLAGSGKTIVLALKAAYLHVQHPDWQIGVTFQTRSLKGQFKKLITTFVLEQGHEEPDWDKIKIMHAWGAPGGGEKEGIYYLFCARNNLSYYDFSSARNKFGKGGEFGAVCELALKSLSSSSAKFFDAVLVDEAQDFPPEFLRICYKLLKRPNRLVYAYDELQNLSNSSLPSPEKIFGKKKDGTPRVKFLPPEPGTPKQDVILEKCYRNSRPVLTTAHALGFGIYRDVDPDLKTGLIQIFDDNFLWKEVGYEVKEGELKGGEEVVLARTNKTSPDFLEEPSKTSALIEFLVFDDYESQANWVAKEIEKNLKSDELCHDDIVVINPDPLTTRQHVGVIRNLLFEKEIQSHLAGVDTSPDVFFKSEEESVAFTGIYRAKGNEAGMVYVINAQDCYSSSYQLSTVRNRLFTAITRSKAWVRVLGIGSHMNKLKYEFDKVVGEDFTLRFNYPTDQQKKHLNIVNRDMSEEEKKMIKRRNLDLNNIIKDLESERMFLEDIDKEKLKKLKELLNKQKL